MSGKLIASPVVRLMASALALIMGVYLSQFWTPIWGEAVSGNKAEFSGYCELATQERKWPVGMDVRTGGFVTSAAPIICTKSTTALAVNLTAGGNSTISYVPTNSSQGTMSPLMVVFWDFMGVLPIIMIIGGFIIGVGTVYQQTRNKNSMDGL